MNTAGRTRGRPYSEKIFLSLTICWARAALVLLKGKSRRATAS